MKKTKDIINDKLPLINEIFNAETLSKAVTFVASTSKCTTNEDNRKVFFVDDLSYRNLACKVIKEAVDKNYTIEDKLHSTKSSYNSLTLAIDITVKNEEDETQVLIQMRDVVGNAYEEPLSQIIVDLVKLNKRFIFNSICEDFTIITPEKINTSKSGIDICLRSFVGEALTHMSDQYKCWLYLSGVSLEVYNDR